MGSSGASGLPPPPPPRPDLLPQSGPVSWARQHRLATSALALVVLMAVVAALGNNRGDTAASSPSPAVETATPSTSPSPSTDTAVVPKAVGLREAKAVAQLEARGFTVVVSRKFSARRRGVVFRQFTPAGTTATIGDTITILVAKPIPRIPGLLGRAVRSARRQLEDRGYVVVVRKRVSDQPAGTILSMANGSF
jgi:rhodanese-related sulfurtransferase